MDATTTTLCLCIGVASVLAVLYDRCTKGIPSRLRAGEAPQSASGFVRADTFSLPDKPARAHGIDIVFVHGLGSNPDTTWGRRESNWVNDFLTQDIPKVFHEDIRIFFYNYDSYWKRDAVQTRLWRLGKSLLDGMCSLIRGTEEERTRSLIFVGHSYGGLVIKRALILAYQDQAFNHVAEHTRGVVFLGTPHRGSSFSTWGSLAARALGPLGSNPSLLQEVEYDALPLLELHEEFESARSEKLQVVNFFEQRKMRLVKVWFFRWDEFCVREQSATYSRVENIGLSVDHYGLNKYTSRDGNYKRILGKLLNIITPIASQKQHQLYSVPIATVESYVKRDLLSTKIEDELRVHDQEAGVPRVLIIHGLGGTGKTQLARQYIEDYKDEYNPILWIDSTDQGSVQASFKRCAGELGLPVDQGSIQTSKLADSLAVQAVLRWFRNRKRTDDRWLVVFDNADDHKMEVQSVIPKGNYGSIIITSQDSNLLNRMKDYREVEVGTMESLEAKTLLLRHLKLEVSIAAEDILVDCNKIAEKLGYLPLAVDLAGAYIGRSKKDPIRALRQYLVDYDKQHDYLLKDTRFCDSSASEKTVWTVWSTTLKRIEQNHADLRPDLLLAFLARFRSGVVQDELLRLASLSLSTVAQKMYGGTAELPNWLAKILELDEKGWVDFHYRQGCDVLVQYSLLQRTPGTWQGVRMHSLVKWRAKKYEEEQPWEKWYLMTVLAGCVQLSRDHARPAFRRELVTNVPAPDERYLDEVGVDDKRKEFVWHTVGTVYFYEGRWKEAEELEVQVMETSSRVLGKEHPDTLTSMNNLAFTLKSQSRNQEALALLEKCFQLCKSIHGEQYPHTELVHATLGKWRAENNSKVDL
ncbi:uncharacterized protein M421DRAFT_338260 [Didymella exigua CBS 183.55]|uniref:GPI inositol-deacylase n=1 Tax=Didymella exigua CBS 183.55 TaxID=1150837 RepID=A0A6A5R644_9PLEO|nr:uncharacterized protein M421DRAFT_338260 [Didymella exigua CBS 183.55]KAF1922859.1 hypothetical protein M421DRAFT_338260 [Didymella exigua CBS 183.55]